MGAESRFLEDFLADLCDMTTDNYSDILLRRCLNNLVMLSADVNAALDPNFEGTHDKFNAAYLEKAWLFLSLAAHEVNQAHRMPMPRSFPGIRKLFNDNDIPWHTTELGTLTKVAVAQSPNLLQTLEWMSSIVVFRAQYALSIRDYFKGRCLCCIQGL